MNNLQPNPNLLDYKWIDALAYCLLLLFIGISPIWIMLNALGYVPIINFAYVILVGVIIICIYEVLQILTTRKKISFPSYQYLVGLSVLVYIIVIQLISYPILFQQDSMKVVVFRNTFVTTGIMSMLFWIVGSRIVKISALLQQFSWQFITMCVYFLYLLIITFSVISIYGAIPSSIFSFHLNMSYNYLYIADGFAILSIIVICLIIKREPLRWLFFFISTLGLYATLSRTPFYIFIIVMLCFLLLNSARQRSLILPTIIGMIFIYKFGTNVIHEQSNVRMFKLVTDISSDTSYVARQELFNVGITQLKENWLFGMFLAELNTGGKGTYFHNYLSFWVSYGVLPFIGFVYSSLFGFIALLRRYLIERYNPLLGFALVYSCFCFLAIVFSRSYVWPHVWLAVAAAPQIVNYYKNNNMANKVRFK